MLNLGSETSEDLEYERDYATDGPDILQPRVVPVFHNKLSRGNNAENVKAALH